jgi:pimeloyl-ACP methyl ester carboxylesterase
VVVSELHPALRPRTVDIDTGELALRCLVWGDERDPPAVLVHGNGGHARWWDPLIPWLVPGWRIVAPHLRGHGESAWAEPPRYALADFARDVDAVLAALAVDAAPLVGHSMGGRVALAYAADHPERVPALAVLDSRFEPIDPAFAATYRKSVAGKREGRSYGTRAEALAAFRFIPDERGVAPSIVAHLAAHAVHERRPGEWSFRFDRGVLTSEGDGAGDLRLLLPGLRCPVFVGAGERSWVMPEPERARIRDAVPHAVLEVFPGAHHFIVRCPERVGPSLRAFLDATRERR